MDARLEKLYAMAMQDVTENLLPWWMQYGRDTENGGFFGAVNIDNKPEIGKSKYIVLAARLVWTFSAAYRVLGKAEYLENAKYAYEYFVGHFYDKENGGFMNRVDAKGEPMDRNKNTYGNAFAIYGLTEYYRVTKDEEALRLAIETRDKLEKYIYDRVYKGYYETFTADWKVTPWVKGMNRTPDEMKTMNTHLHVLEAFTSLARVDPSDKTRNLLRRQLYNMLNKIVDHDIHHYYYFQDRAWNPTTQIISFGHDIEGSWLMMEAANVLGEKEAMEYASEECANIARACLEEGYRAEGYMITDYDPVEDKESERISWWEQNESVVGFLNAWQNTGEEKFLDAAVRSFDFIEKYHVDHLGGGWFLILDKEFKPIRSACKQNDWHCPYHNTRMSLEVIERIREMGE